MLKKNAPCVTTTLILALSAAFALTLAQFPWEGGADSNYDSGSQASSEPEYSFGDPYDETGSFSAVEDSEAEPEGGDASASKQKKVKEKTAKEKTAKAKTAKAKTPKAKTANAKPPQKDQPQRAAGRHRTSGPSFSAAFSGPQKSCPVCTSVRLKGNQYVDYGGGRIHVCSESCISRVRRNPDKFADVLVKRGEQVSTAK